MNPQVTIEEQKMTPEMARLFEQGRRNLFWFSENAERLGVYQHHRGRYVAAAGESYSWLILPKKSDVWPRKSIREKRLTSATSRSKSVSNLCVLTERGLPAQMA